MQLKVIALPIASGIVDLGEGRPDQFLPTLQGFAVAHGFQLKLEPEADDPRSYVFQLVRNDVILEGQNDYESQRSSYIFSRYQFAFMQNYLKYPNLDPVESLKPVVAGLLSDFQDSMKPIGHVRVDK